MSAALRRAAGAVRVAAALACLAGAAGWVAVEASDLSGLHERLVARYLAPHQAREAEARALAAAGEHDEAARVAARGLKALDGVVRGDRAFFIQRRLRALEVDALLAAGRPEEAHRAARRWTEADARDVPAQLAYGRTLEALRLADEPPLAFYGALLDRYYNVADVADAYVRYALSRGRLGLAAAAGARFADEASRLAPLAAVRLTGLGPAGEALGTVEGAQVRTAAGAAPLAEVRATLPRGAAAVLLEVRPQPTFGSAPLAVSVPRPACAAAGPRGAGGRLAWAPVEADPAAWIAPLPPGDGPWTVEGTVAPRFDGLPAPLRELLRDHAWTLDRGDGTPAPLRWSPAGSALYADVDRADPAAAAWTLGLPALRGLSVRRVAVGPAGGALAHARAAEAAPAAGFERWPDRLRLAPGAPAAALRVTLPPDAPGPRLRLWLEAE